MAGTTRRPSARAERTRAPAPNEPNPPRRAKPISRAERSQSPAPSEANSRRRPKPIPRAERSQSPGADRSQFLSPGRRETPPVLCRNPGISTRFAPRIAVRRPKPIPVTRPSPGCPRSHAPRGDGSADAPRRPIRGGRGAAGEAFRGGASGRGAVGFGETSPIPGAERTRACAFGSPRCVSVRDGAGMSDLEPPATGLPKGTRYHRIGAPRRSRNPRRGANPPPRPGRTGAGISGPKPTHDQPDPGGSDDSAEETRLKKARKDIQGLAKQFDLGYV